MDCSLDEALQLLHQWNSSYPSVSVRLSFIGRGLRLSYSAGRITDVSGRVFTFASTHCRVEFDAGITSQVRKFWLNSSEQIPDNLKGVLSEGDECMLVFEGVLGDILVILKMKETISVSKVTGLGEPQHG